MGSYIWVGVIHNDDDSQNRPSFAFQGTETELRTFVKNKFTMKYGNEQHAIEDDDFYENEYRMVIYDLNKYDDLHIFKFDELQTPAHSGGSHRRRKTRNRTRKHK